MSTPKRINRAIATLKLPRKVLDLIKLAQAIVTAYRGVTKAGEGDWSQLITAIVK